MTEKYYSSPSKRVEILRSRNMDIRNSDIQKEILNNHNYYNLINAYKERLKVSIEYRIILFIHSPPTNIGYTIKNNPSIYMLFCVYAFRYCYIVKTTYSWEEILTWD